MPARKSGSGSTAVTNGETSVLSEGASESQQQPGPQQQQQVKKGHPHTSKDTMVGIEDLLLPRTMVARLARGVLPPNTAVARDALLAVSKSASVFASYLASHAQEQTQRTGKKTIQAADVLAALAEIEFAPQFAGRVAAECDAWGAAQAEKREAYKRRAREGRERARAGGAGGVGVDVEGEGGKAEAEGEGEGGRTGVDVQMRDLPAGEPVPKRARRSTGAGEARPGAAEDDEEEEVGGVVDDEEEDGDGADGEEDEGDDVVDEEEEDDGEQEDEIEVMPRRVGPAMGENDDDEEGSESD